MSGTNGTLFRPNGGGGGGGGTVVESLVGNGIFAPDSNDGFTSNSTTNPRGLPLGNSRVPKGPVTEYQVANVLIENRNLPAVSMTGLTGSTVYRVILSPQASDIDCYAFGDIRLMDDKSNYIPPFSVHAINTDVTVGGLALSSRVSASGQPIAVFGVSCRAKKVGFVIGGTAASSTLSTYVDGTLKDSNTLLGSISAAETVFSNTKLKTIMVSSISDSATDDIHDFRLVLTGAARDVIVYGIIIENGNNSIVVPPGSVFVDGNSTLDTLGATFPLPNLGWKGGWFGIQQNASGLTLIGQSIPGVTSIAVGASGTNTMSLQSGHGASFLNSGIFVSGATNYIGRVTQVSIDTLTVSPTLAFGVSGGIVSLFNTDLSATLVQSNYLLYDRVAFGNTSTLAGINTGPFKTTHGYWYASSATTSSTPSLVVGGSDFSNIIPHLYLADSVSFAMTYEGYFNALELEVPGISDQASATVSLVAWSIDGTPEQSATFLINPGYGNTKRVPLGYNFSNSWHRVNIRLANVAAINAYANAISVTNYSQFLAIQGADATFIPTSVGITATSLGVHERVYANEMGGAAVGAGGTSLFPQNIALASETQAYETSYYGKAFAFIGNAFTGGSFLIDGVGTTFTRNSYYTSATNSWHRFQVQASFIPSASQLILGYEYVRPYGEWQYPLPFIGYTSAPQALAIPDPTQIPYVGLAVRSTFGITGAVVSVSMNICNVMRVRNWAHVQGTVLLTGVSTVLGAFTIPNNVGNLPLAVNTSFMPATGADGSSQVFAVGYLQAVAPGSVDNNWGVRTSTVFVNTSSPQLFMFGYRNGSGIIIADAFSTVFPANSYINFNLSFPTSDIGIGASTSQLQLVPLTQL